MKSLGIILSLVRFNLRLLPWYIWPLLVLLSFFQWWFMARITNEWVIGGYGTTGLQGPSILLWIIIGSIFFRAGRGYGGGQIPDGEFLLTRPVLRHTAYFSRMVLFFIIVLTVPLSEVYAAAAKPDLRVDFYHWRDPGVTAGQIKFYQEQFPGNALIHQPYPAFRKEAYEATLMIPLGKMLIALWDLIVTVFIALTLQLAMFSTSPSKFQGWSFYGTLIVFYFFAEVLVTMMFPQLSVRPGPTLFEHVFFFFAHHELLCALFTLEAFGLVQWIALKRIQDLEVI